MVRVLRRVRAITDHVASPSGIVAEHVADLADGEVVVATVVVADGVGVHECHERGVGRVSQRPPGIEEGEAAGRGPNLVVPGLRPLERLACELCVVDGHGLVEPGLLSRRRVQPERGPAELVVVTAKRVVERRRVGNALGRPAAVGIGEGIELPRMHEQRVGVGGAGGAEGDTRRREDKATPLL